MNQIKLKDNSGDKDYFTIIPNYIVNHSTANDQALYMQMKRYAGDSGLCWTSKKTLMEKLGIGMVALNKSIKYLLDHKWITHEGEKKVMTTGGEQKVGVYSINNIWKMNSDHYSKGYARTTPLLSKKGQRVCQNESKGYAETAPKKNYILKEEGSFSLKGEETKKKISEFVKSLKYQS